MEGKEDGGVFEIRGKNDFILKKPVLSLISFLGNILLKEEFKFRKICYSSRKQVTIYRCISFPGCDAKVAHSSDGKYVLTNEHNHP